VTALILLLLFVDFHAAHISTKTDSNQSIASSKGGSARMGTKLRVYLSGDLTLASELKRQLPDIMRAKDLPFEAVTFENEIPADANENPFLSIRLEEDRGFWTPVFATRQIRATILYAQGRPINADDVLSPDHGVVTHLFTEDSCVGECADGRRTVTLSARAVGLVSLPHMRAYAASQVAQEAATLVAAGLPDHLNPGKWSDRASLLAREKLGAQSGGTFASFRRLTGCRGGIAVVGTVGGGSEWDLMYYDAEADAITEILTRREVQAKLPGVVLMDLPGLDSREDALSFYLGGNSFLAIPAGTCGFFGWQIKSQ
jgi:hypothetical protein